MQFDIAAKLKNLADCIFDEFNMLHYQCNVRCNEIQADLPKTKHRSYSKRSQKSQSTDRIRVACSMKAKLRARTKSISKSELRNAQYNLRKRNKESLEERTFSLLQVTTDSLYSLKEVVSPSPVKHMKNNSDLFDSKCFVRLEKGLAQADATLLPLSEESVKDESCNVTLNFNSDNFGSTSTPFDELTGPSSSSTDLNGTYQGIASTEQSSPENLFYSVNKENSEDSTEHPPNFARIQFFKKARLFSPLSEKIKRTDIQKPYSSPVVLAKPLKELKTAIVATTPLPKKFSFGAQTSFVITSKEYNRLSKSVPPCVVSRSTSMARGFYCEKLLQTEEEHSVIDRSMMTDTTSHNTTVTLHAVTPKPSKLIPKPSPHPIQPTLDESHHITPDKSGKEAKTSEHAFSSPKPYIRVAPVTSARTVSGLAKSVHKLPIVEEAEPVVTSKHKTLIKTKPAGKRVDALRSKFEPDQKTKEIQMVSRQKAEGYRQKRVERKMTEKKLRPAVNVPKINSVSVKKNTFVTPTKSNIISTPKPGTASKPKQLLIPSSKTSATVFGEKSIDKSKNLTVSVKLHDSFEKNNLNIDEIDEDYSEDENEYKKHPERFPKWCLNANEIVIRQENSDNTLLVKQLFPPLGPPNLANIFKTSKPRYYKRNSTAVWDKTILCVD